MRKFAIFLFAALPLLFSSEARAWLQDVGVRLRHDSSILTETATNEWRDAQTDVRFTLSESWSILLAYRWGEDETTVAFQDASATHTRASLYYRREKALTVRTSEQADKSLADELAFKVAQRRRQGLPDYTERPGSRRRHEVNGHPALSWAADFTVDGEPLVEAGTFVQSGRVTALFFNRVPAAGLRDFQERFAPTVESLRIP